MSNSEKVCQFIDEAKVYYLATIEDDKPHVRPLGSHKLINNKVYFFIGDFKNVYKQLTNNANCELVASKATGEWMRISGKAIFEKDFAIADIMLNDNKKIKELYEKNGWKAMVFHIEGKVEIIKIMTCEEKFDI